MAKSWKRKYQDLKANKYGKNTTISVGAISQGTAAVTAGVILIEPASHLYSGIKNKVPAPRIATAMADSTMRGLKNNWQLILASGLTGVARVMLNKKGMNPQIVSVKGLVSAKLF